MITTTFRAYEFQSVHSLVLEIVDKIENLQNSHELAAYFVFESSFNKFCSFFLEERAFSYRLYTNELNFVL